MIACLGRPDDIYYKVCLRCWAKVGGRGQIFFREEAFTSSVRTDKIFNLLTPLLKEDHRRRRRRAASSSAARPADVFYNYFGIGIDVVLDGGRKVRRLPH